jgi:cytosine deaminase
MGIEERGMSSNLPIGESPMDIAFREAELAYQRGEVPVGAVVTTRDGLVLARDGNRVEETGDVAAHAEMLVLRQAARALGRPRLFDCDLWVTLEPCAMCAAATVHFRPRRVIFGAYDPKGGGIEHGARVLEAPGCLHKPELIGGVREAQAAALLRLFFARLRQYPSGRSFGTMLES